MAEPDSLAGTLPAGAVFHERYKIVRRISAGGMGAVYECVHLSTRKHRALKVMLPQLVEQPGLRERFQLEARATADIESDHIVETFDAGIDERTGSPFLVMELLRGKDVERMLADGGPLSPDHAVLLLSQAAIALDKTHQAGIVHRDLKPQNLYVTVRDDGSPRLKVLDFGIAKVVAQADKTAKHTATIGTAVYMSPEQILGDGALGPRADLYALGHIAFTLLVGEAYWDEDARTDASPFVLWSKVMAGAQEKPSVRARRHGVSLPADFDDWFMQATAHQASARFERAAPMIAALAAALGVDIDRASSRASFAGLSARAQAESSRESRSATELIGQTPGPWPTPAAPHHSSNPSQPALAGHPSQPVQGADPGHASQPQAWPSQPHPSRPSVPSAQTAQAVARDAGAPPPAPRSRGPVIAASLLGVAALASAGIWFALPSKTPHPATTATPEAPTAVATTVAATAIATATPAVTAVAPAPQILPTTPTADTVGSATPSAPVPAIVPGPGKKLIPQVHTPPPVTPPPVSNRCNPPYEIDASGIRTRKPECR